jgi:hypothetical protein
MDQTASLREEVLGVLAQLLSRTVLIGVNLRSSAAQSIQRISNSEHILGPPMNAD